jgi:integrase
MSLYRREDSPHWWIQVVDPARRRVQQSTGTADRVKAQELHDRIKVKIWDQKRLGVKAIHGWEEAVLRWLSEKTEKVTLANDKVHLRWLDRHLRGRTLSEIDRALIAEITRLRKQPYVVERKKGPVRVINPSPATVNRTLEILRAILRRARDDWEWIDRCPQVQMLQEVAKRVRWITREQAHSLIGELPSHQRAMTQFALETGLRRRNVTHLEWSQVDLERRVAWIHPDQAKAKKAIGVPLSNHAVVILREQVEKHATWVFPYRGKPVTQVATRAWRRAVQRAQITPGFRWHDLRHTWASWHAQDGTPLNVLQELGGWASPEMVQRYAHLATEHLSQWVDRRSGLGTPRVTTNLLR